MAEEMTNGMAAAQADAQAPRQTPQAPQPGGQQELQDRLQTMEELLREQNRLEKKSLRGRGAMLGVMVVFVIAAIVFMVRLDRQIDSVTAQIPGLVQESTQTMEEIQKSLQELDDIDIDGLNKTIGEVGEGVSALREAITALGNLFKNPFGR